jgi:cell division protein FtsN
MVARDWRWLTVAALSAAAVATACLATADAQAPPKAATKKAKQAKEAEQDQDGDEAAKKAAAKKKKQDPAEAQRTIDASVKMLESGKAEAAQQGLTGVLGGGNLPPAIMAKALYYRGIAYRQLKKPAQAIADLTSALWLKGGLTQSDRADALKQRSSAYAEAGLTEGGATVVAAVPGSSNPTAAEPGAAPRATTRTASAAKGWGTETTTSSLAPQEAPVENKQSGSGWTMGNPFAGWFGGSTAASASTPPPSATPTTTASIPPSEPAAAPARPKSSGWARNTEVQGAAATASSPPASAAPAAKPEGRFRIQVGLARTEGEAQALASKVKRDYAAALATREPEIDQTVVGNMGSFYRVRVGPFATAADSQAACAKLKGSGLDCLVVTQ